MTQDHLAQDLLEIDELNIEADLDFILSIKFLAHNKEWRLSQIQGRMAGNSCSLKQKFPNRSI